MLTQAEIDALLAGSIEIEGASNEGSVNLANLLGQAPASPGKDLNPGRQVRPYNFWSPDHFSKDQMRAVELVHEDLAERLTSSLPSFIRTNLRPRVVHTEQGRFHDFLKDLPSASLFHIISLSPLPGQMLLTISPDVSYVILEQRLGGQGERGSKKRTMTEIDVYLLRSVVEHMLNDIKASWSKVVAVEPGLEDSTINQHWVQMVMGNERVMLITFELVLQNVTGTMNIYIPFPMLKPIASVLSPHVWFSGRKERQSDPEARHTATENLAQVTLPLRVFLGSAGIPVKDLINLKVGDVVCLDNQVDRELVVDISGQTCFLGRVGKIGKKLAVQITAAVGPKKGLDVKNQKANEKNLEK
jgi:flagellar motor switch protein FliM